MGSAHVPIEVGQVVPLTAPTVMAGQRRASVAVSAPSFCDSAAVMAKAGLSSAAVV